VAGRGADKFLARDPFQQVRAGRPEKGMAGEVVDDGIGVEMASAPRGEKAREQIPLCPRAVCAVLRTPTFPFNPGLSRYAASLYD
jgi:hypothetical protein